MKPAALEGIKASGSVAPIIKIHGLADVPGFQLTLTTRTWPAKAGPQKRSTSTPSAGTAM